MGGVRGAAVAVLSLTALETVVSSTGAADRTSGILSGVASIIDRVLSPTVPAIPNLSGDTNLDVTPVTTPAQAYDQQQIPTKYLPPRAPTTATAGAPTSTPTPTPTAAPPTGQG